MADRKRTGIVRDPRYAAHCMEADHPECPQRIEVVNAMLAELSSHEAFSELAPRRAEEADLLRVHSPEHIARLKATEDLEGVYLDADTCTSPLSHATALLAAGGLCLAVEQVAKGLVANAFALVRPPGHHAERNRAKGFCLYNNVAIAARYAQKILGVGRILIVDWDLHHGNGTQHCFEDDPSVLFFSIHRAFAYPGGGRLKEIGRGPGKGTTVNIPLLPGFGDGDYLALFENILRPIALEFKPDFILVSAGFDIHHRDPLGGMQVTPRGFAAMTRSLLQIAERCCGGKTVLTLEGGYDLDGLRESVRAVLMELAGLQFTDPAEVLKAADPKKTAYVLWRVRRAHRRRWASLAAPPEGALGAEPGLAERMKSGVQRILAYFNS